MSRLVSFLRTTGIIAVLFMSGCSHHKYPCGRVPLCYKAPPPLPYTGYCKCPTPIAKKYLSHDVPQPAAEPQDTLPLPPDEATKP